MEWNGMELERSKPGSVEWNVELVELVEWVEFHGIDFFRQKVQNPTENGS